MPGFAIVGCGMIAGFHLKALAEIDGARVVAVVDKVPAALERFKDKHKLACSFYTALEPALTNPQVDIVIVSTPSGAHMEPAVQAMAKQGTPFSGFLYAGLIMTPRGPQVLEFNARLGDPETQALMLRLSSDLAPTLQAAALGHLKEATLTWNPDPSVCVVLASAGYPGNVRVGDPITGLDKLTHSVAFHSGTNLHQNVLTTAGGRVLGITASAPTLPAAINAAYSELPKIHFNGMQYRTDIGKKGLKRW